MSDFDQRDDNDQENVPDPIRQDAILDKRAKIIKKATRLFIKKGYAQTTMRDISKATGINLGNLYNYISSKEDILCLSFETYHDPATD
ncbi:MAG: helix-turn-helix domain-containing protein, partial [Smithellaceae bacterium]